MNRSSRVLLLGACVAASSCDRAAAFSPPVRARRPAIAPARGRGLATSRPAAVAPEPEGKSDANPATRFGAPLSDPVRAANRAAVRFLKRAVFDTLFAAGADRDRDYARFYALETIARVPYFSYLSVLHLYETLGWWRRAKYLKLHFAESWNEMHHLLIMEELGGNDRYRDRFIAQHIAVGYFLFVVALYLVNPAEAYGFNQDVEEHAAATYEAYLTEHRGTLERLPAPRAAVDYYVEGDLYMFDEFQTSCEVRRPKIDNLYDVFVAIRDDELAHAKTMELLQTELDIASIHDGECEIDVA